MITRISDNEEINSQNYLESIDYISNLYSFLKELGEVIPLSKMQFLPSFKGKYIVQKLGIPATDKENEMKVFKVRSTLFLGDRPLLQEIKLKMASICEEIIVFDDTIIFYLP